MIKKELRAAIIAQLQTHAPAQKAARDQLLLADVLNSRAYKQAKTIATYLAFEHEFQTAALISAALKDKKTVLIPKTYPKGKMIFGRYDEQKLIKTKFGLLEPVSDEAFPKEAIDLIHVPGVAFNAQHYRIGYGAGYYDRYLSDFKGATLSTIYDFQQADFAPENHDVAVEEVFIR